MKLTVSLLSFAILGGFALGDKITFDEARTGAAPAGWTATQTGSGSAKWTVEKDESAPSKPHVLKQSGEATFAVCLKNDTRVKDGFVEVKFKPVSGREDQAGGVVWRAADADNYYIARANALEDNVSIYHTIKGRRAEFKSAKERVKSGVWHTLRVDFRADRFIVTFDGKRVLEANDGTFKDGGKVGVWTKADSVTLFDDFVFGEL